MSAIEAALDEINDVELLTKIKKMVELRITKIITKME